MSDLRCLRSAPSAQREQSSIRKVQVMSNTMDVDTIALTRSGLLGRVSDDLKMSVKSHHLTHAQRLGFVSAAPLVGGWSRYSEQHVVQLSNYMKTYSRSRPQKNGGES
jgi:hypothetical protein